MNLKVLNTPYVLLVSELVMTKTNLVFSKQGGSVNRSMFDISTELPRLHHKHSHKNCVLYNKEQFVHGIHARISQTFVEIIPPVQYILIYKLLIFYILIIY